jgi:hypothetical protein
VAELKAVEVADRAVEAGEKGHTLIGNVDVNAAAVRAFAAPADETALFEPVEEAGNIGIAGDHPVSDFAA